MSGISLDSIFFSVITSILPILSPTPRPCPLVGERLQRQSPHLTEIHRGILLLVQLSNQCSTYHRDTLESEREHRGQYAMHNRGECTEETYMLSPRMMYSPSTTCSTPTAHQIRQSTPHHTPKQNYTDTNGGGGIYVKNVTVHAHRLVYLSHSQFRQ